MHKYILASVLGALAFPHAQTAAPETAPAAPPAPTPKDAKAPVEPKASKKKAKPAAKKVAKKKPSGKSGASAEGVTGPAVLKKYAPNYKKGGTDGKAKTASGNVTIDSGDKLADKLRGKPIDEVYDEAVKVLNTALEEGQEKHTKKSLMDKYGKLNLGMQRMNLGNRMRSILFPKAAAPKKEKKVAPKAAKTEAPAAPVAVPAKA